MEVKIAVIKEWVDGFVPMSLMEERFKEVVKEALKHVTQDFKVASANTCGWDPDKTCESNIKKLKSLGVRIMGIYEYRLMWAQMVAEGYDVIGFYYGTESRSSQKPEVDIHIDRSTDVSWLTVENL